MPENVLVDCREAAGPAGGMTEYGGAPVKSPAATGWHYGVESGEKFYCGISVLGADA